MLSLLSPAAADLPHVGDVLLIDQEEASGATIYAQSMESGALHVVATRPEFGVPEAIAWGPRKRLYIADGGRVHVVNPYAPTDPDEFYEDPHLRRLTDIISDGGDGYYLLDRTADPLGEGYRGAVFHLDPASGEIVLVATGPGLGSPAKMALEEDGKLLVLDPAGRVSEEGDPLGALFRVDPETRSIAAVTGLEFTVQPRSLALLDASRLLIVDADFSVQGMPVAHGAVLVLSRDTFAVIDTLAAPDFLGPADVAIDFDGKILVLDPEANPDGYTLGRGATFLIDPETGDSEYVQSPHHRALIALDVLGGPDIDTSSFSLIDVNQPPARIGDLFEFQAGVINTGVATTEAFTLTVALHGLVPLPDSDFGANGGPEIDPQLNQVIWTGELEPQEALTFTLFARVPDTIEAGSAVGVVINADGKWVEIDQEISYWIRVPYVEGEPIFADPGTAEPAPRLFVLGENELFDTETFEADPVLMPVPVDLTFGTGGEIYIVDGEIGNGKIVRIDPSFIHHPELLYAGPPLKRVTAVCLGHDGNLLIADQKNPKFGPVNEPGVIYHFDLSTERLTEFARDPDMLDPMDICVDGAGGYVVVDYAAEFGGSDSGAMFEFDGDGYIFRRRSFSLFKDPVSAVVASDGTLFIGDARWAPEYERGRIYRIVRETLGDSTGGIYLGSATFDGDSLLELPYGLELADDDTLIVCDPESDPGSHGGDRGAITRLSRAGLLYDLSVLNLSADLRDPRRAAIFRLPALEISQLRLEDRSGGLLGRGDTLDVRAVIRNQAATPALGVTALMEYSGSLQLLSAAAERGSLYDNMSYHTLHWSGDLTYIRPLEITASFLVDSTATNAEIVEIAMRLEGAGTPPARAVRDTVFAPVDPLVGGELLILDLSADPYGTGAGRGCFYILDESTGEMVPYFVDPAVERASDMLAETTEDFLVLESWAAMGGGVGGVLQLNVIDETLEHLITDPNFAGPGRFVRAPDGALLIVDPRADLLSGDARGAVFRYHPDEGIVGLFSMSHAYRALTDIAFGDNGRLWVSDMMADPLGLGGNRSAIFELDPESGDVIDTLQVDEMLDPRSLLWIPDHGLLFTDPTWEDAYGNTGVRVVDPDTGEILLSAASPYMLAPSRMYWTGGSRVLIVDSAADVPLGDAGRGAIFALDLEDNPAIPVPFGVHPTTAELYSFARVPMSAPQIVSFGADEDATGRWAWRGEPLHCELRMTNTARVPEKGAGLTIELSEHLFLNPLSLTASAGQVSAEAQEIFWQGDLTYGDTVAIRYEATIRTTPGLSSWADQHAEIDTRRGDQTTGQLTYYISSRITPDDMLLVDHRANPRGFEGQTGAVFRLARNEWFAWEAVPILADTLLTSPTDIARVPQSDSLILIADADANLTGTGTGGGVLLGNTVTGEVTPFFHDSTLVEPWALAVQDSVTCYLLDESADPFGLRPSGLAPGAIYKLDLLTGEGEIVFSDTLIGRPQDLIVNPTTGLLYLVARRVGDQTGDYFGGIVEIDPASGEHRIVRAGAPFRSPRTLVFDRDGNLVVVDGGLSPDYQPMTYVLELDGVAIDVLAKCPLLSDPTDILIGENDAFLIVDRYANPEQKPEPTGTVFRLNRSGVCTAYLTGPPLVNPRGLDFRPDATPVLLVSFELREVDGGVEVCWMAPGALVEAEYYLFRREAGEVGDYLPLNPLAPMRGTGELVFLDPGVVGGEVYEYVLLAMLPDGTQLEYGPLQISVAAVRDVFRLERVTPNPLWMAASTPYVTLRFHIPQSTTDTRLGVFDITGRLVRRLHDGPIKPGSHALFWDARDEAGAPVASGVYFVRLEAGARREMRRVVLVR